ncbi:MAG TPA: DASS family sodium-coupled anion symporter [Gemmatimonadales bacterium]|nr:DASS family sodium-coupled anion symporter [Gemmatimonadales bacterium]
MPEPPHNEPPLQSTGPVAVETLSAAEEAFERWRRRAGVVLAPVAFAAVHVLSTGLSGPGRTLAAILAAIVVLWVTETLPLAVTALLGAVLAVVLGVAPAKQVFAHFGDPIIFLFIGSFILARAMAVHRLDQRIALGFLSMRSLSASPARLLAGVGVVTAFLSMWDSNTATTAMMLPIALGILGALHEARVAAGTASGPIDARSWSFATAMMLMIAYSASIGGLGTPVGSPPNLIGIGFIRNSTGVSIDFFTWMSLAVPILLVMAVVLFVMLHRLHPDRVQRGDAGDADHVEAIRQYVAWERAALGGWTRGQINTLVAFGVAVILWTLPGILAVLGVADSAAGVWLQSRMPEAVAALIAAILLFVLPTGGGTAPATLSWNDAASIDWGTILLFGGGLALGSLMFETGVATAIGEGLAGGLGASSTWTLTFGAIALGIVLSETTSNTASASMAVPVVIAIAQAGGVNPVPAALGACFGASFGFMLPVSTPPNAIVYGSGLVPIPRMIRAGVLFDVVGLFIIWIGLRVLCPLLGLG